MGKYDYFDGSHNPINAIKSLHFDSQFYQDNPDYFHPSGIIAFTGCQGSGKSLSAIKCLKNMVHDYPKCVVCSNLEILDLPVPLVPFTDYEQLSSLTNGINGVIFLIDEIHVLWNSLESKNIPISEMACFAQMRKDRRVILGTSQVYSRIAKPIREQLSLVVKCRNVLKYLQINTIIDPNGENCKGEDDGECDGEIVAKKWFFHSPADYTAYNTLKKIERMRRKKGVI